MNYEEFTKNKNDSILGVLLEKKGQFSRATWCRPVKTKKGCPQEYRKCTIMNVRSGIEYDNLKAVKEGRESGELPEENAGLPWGEWEIYPILIKHKDVQYARLYPAPDCTTEVQYFDASGNPVSYEDVEEWMLSSEKRKENEDAPLCITVKLGDMIELY